METVEGSCSSQKSVKGNSYSACTVPTSSCTQSFHHHKYSPSPVRNQETEVLSHLLAQNTQAVNSKEDSGSFPLSTLAFCTFQLPTQGNGVLDAFFLQLFLGNRRPSIRGLFRFSQEESHTVNWYEEEALLVLR